MRKARRVPSSIVLKTNSPGHRLNITIATFRLNTEYLIFVTSPLENLTCFALSGCSNGIAFMTARVMSPLVSSSNSTKSAPKNAPAVMPSAARRS